MWPVARVVLGAIWSFLTIMVRVPILLLAIALIFGGVWHYRLAAAKADIEALTAELSSVKESLTACQAASATNVDAVLRLRGMLVTCVGDKSAFDEAAVEMNQVREQYMRSMQKDIIRMREERNALYAQFQTCATHRTEPVCDPLDRRLRQMGQAPD